MNTATSPLPVVAVLGIGRMGLPMASRLCQAGFSVHAWNRSRAKAQPLAALGATVHDQVSDAVRQADIVISLLENGPVVEAVLFDQGAAQAMRAGTLVVDMASIKPAEARDHAQRLQALGVQHVDAPVSGGTVAAEAGTLAIMVGGTEDDFSHAKPLLEKMGGNVVLIGEIGAGHAVKALNNLLGATILAATAEIFAAGEKFGLDPHVMQKIINTSSGRSFSTDLTYPKAVLPKTWDFGFAMGLMNKDIGIAMSLIESTGVDTTLNRQASEMWAKAMATTGPTSDMSEIVRLIYQRAGL